MISPQKAPSPAQQNAVHVQRTLESIIGGVQKVIVGKEKNLRLVAAGMVTEGCHILFEDMPGLAKSVMASAFAKASGCEFRRVQFTPDLLPGDITGTYIFNQQTNEFSMRPGPIFSNILLADEINRASPKTQSALLEAMAEKQVSIEGTTHRLPSPFMVLATQNPVEQEGTYPLPEAQLDRFTLKLTMGYPTKAEEREILVRRTKRGKDSFDVNAVSSPEALAKLAHAVESVHVSPTIFDYITEIIDRTREHPQLLAGSSPRGSLALLKLARSWSAVHGRHYVTPNDIKELAVPVLAHRIIVRPEARFAGATGAAIVAGILGETPVPKFTETA
jgi:MoxR-like ATPase